MLFSVIVPVYKVEAYLEDCLNSILNQTCPDLELIIVDDGSPDRCPEICDRCAAKDPRVKVIHKENGGLVSARKAGIEQARGEYIIHVDGDDKLNETMLEKAQQIIRETDPDIISFSVDYVRPNHTVETVHEPLPEGLYDKDRCRAEIYPKVLMMPDMKHLFYYLWGKALRRSLAYPCQMAIDNAIALGEDVSGTIPTYFAAERVYISHFPGYLCTVRQDSMSRSFRLEHFRHLSLGVEHLRNLSCEIPEGFDAQISRYAAAMTFILVDGAAGSKSGQQIPDIKKAIQDPVLFREIARAQFRGITPKSRIAIWLIQRHWIRAAYGFLGLCQQIKKAIGRNG